MNGVAIALLLAWPGPEGLRTIYAEDYRGKWLDEKVMRATSREIARSVFGLPTGIKFFAPTNDSKPRAFGLVADYRLRGDFEITTTFDELRAATPDVDYAGYGLFVQLASRTADGVSLVRGARSGKKDGLFSIVTRAVDGKRSTRFADFAAAQDSGKLRIARSGREVILSAADGQGPIQELQRLSLGDEPIDVIRIAAHAARSGPSVVVAVQDLSIRAADAVAIPRSAPVPAFPFRQQAPAEVAQAQPGFSTLVEQDFRGKPFDERLLRPMNAEAAAYLTSEADGIRIEAPPGKGKPRTLGLVNEDRLRGDFDVTISFERLQMERPTNDFVGVGLFVMTDSSPPDSVSLVRGWRAAKASGLFSIQVTVPRGTPQIVDFPAAELRGKLRIARVGAEAVLSCIDGDSDWRELQRVTLGNDDIKMVRVAGYAARSGPSTFVTVRELTIRSGSAPVAATASSREAVPGSSSAAGPRGWRLVAFAGVTALLLLGFLWHRHRARWIVPVGRTGAPPPTGPEAP